ncbi:hypothetical protein [Clostridium sp. CF012]|uniref:hypothetical protein n=1 Tax=Clostridium sp. CF012 TaxID=2843319 RepID=UPI001C0E65DA|nr:hypothetical protein [Clostridium sp. CF012]MBU3143480.1 hypothetical protein [Clostridium sp. CF012]
MKKLLSKALSILIFLSMVLPSASTVFARGIIANNITPVNNAVGTPDTVTVAGLEVGDIVKVYSDATVATAIATVTATSITRQIIIAGKTISGTETIALASIPQLGAGAGSVYVSVTSKGLVESDRVQVSYVAEAATIVSPIMKGTTVNNSVGTPDTITITGLALGDIIKVYSTATVDGTAGIGSAIATATASADRVGNGITATATIPQLGAAGGNVYVSVTSKGLLESDKLIKVQYFAEQRSSTPFLSNITSKNNAVGTSDTVTVTNLVVGDIVKIYSDATSNGEYSVGKAIGTAIATADKVTIGTTTTGTATVSIPQLGAVAGNIYVSVISKGLIESTITTAVAYLAEPKSTAPFVADIKSVNNAAGTTDTVTITALVAEDIVKAYQPVVGLVAGDIVKVYQAATGGIAIGTATAASRVITIGSQPIKIKEVTAIANIPQLGVVAGNVYVTVTSKGLLESDRTQVAYAAEAATIISPLTKGTTVNNAVGTPDTVTITGLAVGDIVKVYPAAIIDGTAIGTATATGTSDKGWNGAIATASIAQFGTGAGNVYVTVTSKGFLESDKLIKVPYFGEKRSNTPFVSNITPKNNAVGTPDTVIVTNLQVGDIVKIYSTATANGESAVGEAMGTAIATADKVATGIAKVSIPQLGTARGYIYVSVISKGLLESTITTPVAYLAESKSPTPFAGNITTKNNAYGTSDTVIVTGLAVGDIVKVYSAATIDGTRGVGTAIGTATGVANIVVKGMVATSTATVVIPQIGVAKGKIYISVTSKDCLESDITTAVEYDAEVKSKTPIVVH